MQLAEECLENPDNRGAAYRVNPFREEGLLLYELPELFVAAHVDGVVGEVQGCVGLHSVCFVGGDWFEGFRVVFEYGGDAGLVYEVDVVADLRWAGPGGGH